jgi:hypothetical protein
MKKLNCGKKRLSMILCSAALLLAGCGNPQNGGIDTSHAASKPDTADIESTAEKTDDSRPEAPGELKKKYFLGISPSQSVDIPDEEWANYNELGVKSLRIHIQLGNIGNDAANPDFSKYDEVVERAAAEDIETVLLLSYESYRSSAKDLNLGWGNILDFKDDCTNIIPVVKAVIIHYKGKVRKYEIWNEQNGMWNIEAGKYAELLTEIYEKCKYTEKWDEEAIIAFGGLDAVNVAWDATGTNGGSVDYFRGFYKTAAYKAFKEKYNRSPFDAVAVHPYNTLSINKNIEVDYNKIASAVKLTVVDTMEANGDKDIPVWITEFGNQDSDDDINAKAVYEAIKEIYKIPQVETLHWFKYLYPGGNESGYSIVHSDGTKRKSYYSFRRAAMDIAAEEN